MPTAFTFSLLEASIREVSSKIRKQDFLTYFKKFSLLSVDEKSITIGVVSSFHRDNLIRKFYDDIKSAIQTVAPSIETLDFIVDDSIDTRGEEEVIDARLLLKDTIKEQKKQQIE